MFQTLVFSCCCCLFAGFYHVFVRFSLFVYFYLCYDELSKVSFVVVVVVCLFVCLLGFTTFYYVLFCLLLPLLC